uniref:Uncharacterized protein n=1 Tax=Oryza punctata TaxID=4537 RepID=A0A0E0JS03_ORYPU
MEGLIPFIYKAIKERRSRTYSRCSSDMSAARRFGRVEEEEEDVVVWGEKKQWVVDGGKFAGGEREMTAHRRHRSLEELAGEVGASPQWRQQGGLPRGRSARIFSCVSGIARLQLVRRALLEEEGVGMEAMSAFAPPPPPTQLMVPVVGYGGGGGAGEGTTTAVRGSYGPVIAMLAVLAVLAAVAVAVGRLCFGRRVLGQAAGGHDLEAWVERTCGPCVGATIFSTAGGGGAAKEEGGEASAAPAEPPPPPPVAEQTERGEGSGIVSGDGS